MTTTATNLRRKAIEAKSLYAAGDITHDELIAIAQEYIDECNRQAARLAKKFGMKPKFMSVKAWLR